MRKNAATPLSAALLFVRCLMLVLATATLAACGASNSLADESATVSSATYWSRQFTFSSTGPITVDLTSTGRVSCFLMNASQYSSFQSTVARGGGSFTYMQDFSESNTNHFSKKARLPAGTWAFVVMTTDYSRMSFGPGQSASFTVKINGGMGSSAGGGNSPSAPPSPPSMTVAPTPVMPNAPTMPPARNDPPPPPPLKLTFATLEEAIDLLTRGRPPERQAALIYLSEQPVAADRRQIVFAALLTAMQDRTLQRQATPAAIKWASKENIPQLRSHVLSIVGGNASRLDPAVAEDALAVIRYLLSAGDVDSVRLAIRLLQSPNTHDAARDALVEFNAPAEPAFLQSIAQSPNVQITQDLLTILPNLGTAISVEPLQDLIGGKDQAISKAANESLTKLAARLKLTPEQYLFNIFNRYTIEAPFGFTPDTATALPPNTRRWTRQASGRAVKSSFTVQVRHVPKDFQFNVSPNASTLVVGPLTFRGMEVPAGPQFIQAARMAALDGEYFIDITAYVDTADGTGQTNVTNAVKKIKAK